MPPRAGIVPVPCRGTPCEGCPRKPLIPTVAACAASGVRHDQEEPGARRAAGPHAGVHRVFHGLDDVWRDRHTDQQDARPQRHRVWFADRHTGAHRLADPRAAGHLDRQVRRSHRDDAADGVHRAGHLADELRHRLLALPGHRSVRGSGRRLVLGGHALCGALVPQEEPGLRDGCLWRGQLGRGGQQVRGASAAGGLRLDDGAHGLRGDHAGHGRAFLVLQRQ